MSDLWFYSNAPLAYLAERYWSRRTPLIIAVLLLIGSQALFMEARVYWVMIIARVVQGMRYVSKALSNSWADIIIQ
jgi:predicted MFS family arabinose efflux permease